MRRPLTLVTFDLGHVLWELHENDLAQAEFASAIDLIISLDDATEAMPSHARRFACKIASRADGSRALVHRAQLTDDAAQGRLMLERAISD